MNVKEHLTSHGVNYQVLEHSPTGDAQHLAHAVHVSGDVVAKAVLLRADHGFRYVTAIIPASRQLDFELASRSFGHSELKVASETEVSQVCADCDEGVLLPFGSTYGTKTLVDSSLQQSNEIVFEGNRHTEAIRMKFADFCRLESPLILPLTQPR